jgi:hypothetical protein
MILNDDAFARIVAEDVKNNADSTQKAYLRAPDVVDRWREALSALLGNLDEQIGDIDRAEQEALDRAPDERYKFEVQQEFEHKRTKITRFRFHVEKRLAEADRLVLLNEGKSLDSVESFLRKAIEQHQELMLDFDLEPTSIDEALWASVTGRWTFGDIDPAEFE